MMRVIYRVGLFVGYMALLVFAFGLVKHDVTVEVVSLFVSFVGTWTSLITADYRRLDGLEDDDEIL